MIAIALTALLWQEEVARLVEALRADNIETRDRAEAELVRIGARGYDPLKRALGDPDAELRARAGVILDELGRRERVAAVHPAPKRLTLELKDVPLSEAALEVFEPFGADSKIDETLRARKVSISLKDATLWQAHDAFIASSGVSVRPVIVPGAWEKHSRTVDVDDARIRIGVVDWDGPKVGFNVTLPPGHLVMEIRVDGLKINDDRGRRIPGKSAGEGRFINCRYRGFSTIGATVAVSVPEGSRSLDIEATLVLVYPYDIERYEYDVRDFTSPIEKRIDRGTVTLTSLKERGVSIGYTGIIEKPGRFYLWVEDAQGRWLRDASTWFRLYGSGAGCTSAYFGLEQGVEPAACVLAHLSGEETVELPVVVKQLKLPEK